MNASLTRKGKIVNKFEIITDKSKWEINESNLREWLCEHPFQEKWYGKNGLCDDPKYRDEHHNHNELWYEYIDSVLDNEVERIIELGKQDYGWREPDYSGYEARYISATVRYIGEQN